MQKEKFNIEESLPYILGNTVQCFKNALLQEFKNSGSNITTEQWGVLARLYYEDGLFQKQIADCLYKDKPTVTRILDILEKRNLIIRIPDDKDRRKFKIYLTQEGKDQVGKLIPIASNFESSVGEIFNEKDKEQLIEYLNRISSKFILN